MKTVLMLHNDSLLIISCLLREYLESYKIRDLTAGAFELLLIHAPLGSTELNIGLTFMRLIFMTIRKVIVAYNAKPKKVRTAIGNSAGKNSRYTRAGPLGISWLKNLVF